MLYYRYKQVWYRGCAGAFQASERSSSLLTCSTVPMGQIKGIILRISIIATSVETKPTSNGKSYQQLEVTFKNLTFNKTESKKIMSFGAGEGAFKVLSLAQPNQTFEVTVVKNDKGFNDWTSVVAASGDAAPAPAAGKGNTNQSVGRSTYETPEERAQRQILIVRQSSVSSALSMLGIGAKAPPELSKVLETAQAISDFVFQVKDKGPSGFADFPDVPDFDAEVQ